MGRLTTVTDALSQVTRYGYDELATAWGRPTPTATSRASSTTAGRQTKRVLPDGAAELFAYDAAGNRTTRTDFMGRTTPTATTCRTGC